MARIENLECNVDEFQNDMNGTRRDERVSRSLRVEWVPTASNVMGRAESCSRDDAGRAEIGC